MTNSNEIILHIWPANWGLPTIDPSCLAAVIIMQQAIPGKFSIAECNNPDLSPTGQLPFLIHDQHIVTTLPLIVKYVAAFKNFGNVPSKNPDEKLTPTEKSQQTAWCAHIESNLGDIVYHVLYSHHGNWAGLTNPALASMLPVPQRYFVPGRIRGSYRPRLEAAGLWGLPEVEKEDKKSFGAQSKPKKDEETKHVFLQAFEREKVLEKARTLFDIYARLLGDRDFIYSSGPTTIDVILVAHMLLLLNPKYPDPFIQMLVTNSYPTLSAHARRVYDKVFDTTDSPMRIASPRKFLWSSLLPGSSLKKTTEKTPEDVHYDRMRWGFFGLAIGSLAAYIVIVGSGLARMRHDLDEEERG